MSAIQKLPVWMRRDCAIWCQRNHQHTDPQDDRACESAEETIALSLNPAHGGDGDLGPHLPEAAVSMSQEPREYEPRITVSLPSLVEDLTLSEASALSSALARLVHEAREGSKEVHRW